MMTKFVDSVLDFPNPTFDDILGGLRQTRTAQGASARANVGSLAQTAPYTASSATKGYLTTPSVNLMMSPVRDHAQTSYATL
jgi:hypothetical protein